MVITLMWAHSWTAITISVCVLAVVVLFLVFCLCFSWEKDGEQSHQFYILDENGMKKAHEIGTNLSNNGGFFRRFSSSTMMKPTFKFTSHFDTEKMLSTYEKKLSPDDRELMDSLDIDKQFNDVVLQIEARKDGCDDAMSCISNDSHCTFFSVHSLMHPNDNDLETITKD